MLMALNIELFPRVSGDFFFSAGKANSSGRGNTSYVSVEFISAAIFSAGV